MRNHNLMISAGVIVASLLCSPPARAWEADDPIVYFAATLIMAHEYCGGLNEDGKEFVRDFEISKHDPLNKNLRLVEMARRALGNTRFCIKLQSIEQVSSMMKGYQLPPWMKDYSK